MKLSRTFYAIFLILSFIFGSAFSQDKTVKKDTNKISEPIEVKINLMALNSESQYDNNIKIEDLKLFEDGIEQKITYFAGKNPVVNVGLVFDNSGSVRDHLNEVSQAGKLIVANLTPGDEAFVVRFIDSNKIEMTQEWTADKAALNDAIDNLFIEGGQTAVLDAIHLSAEKILEREKNDKSKRYGIILFSDAEDRDSYYSFNEVSKLFEGTDLQIFLVSYAEDAPVQKKKALRLANMIPFEIGGTTYSIPKKHTNDDLYAALKAIMIELRSNYVIGYVPTNTKRDGLPRKISVQIADSEKGEKRQGVVRESFTIPKN